MKAGTLHLADVGGTEWAYAAFEAVQPCYEALATSVKPESEIAPWGTTSPMGVFEELPGQPWRMNDGGGVPFPCPAPGGASPGLDNGSLPVKALQQWGLGYARDCADVVYPVQPH